MNIDNANKLALDLYGRYRKSTGNASTVVPNADLLVAIEALRRVPELVAALREASEQLREKCPAVEWNVKQADKIDALIKAVQS